MVRSVSMIELPIKSGITCTIPILNFTIVTFIFMSCWINNVQALFDPLQHDASCLILRPLFTGSTGNTSTMDPMQKPVTIFRYETHYYATGFFSASRLGVAKVLRGLDVRFGQPSDRLHRHTSSDSASIETTRTGAARTFPSVP